MHGLDGIDCKNESVFRELEKPSRIVLDHVSSPRFRVVATFGVAGEKTKFGFRMIFKTAATRNRVKGIVVNANGKSFGHPASRLRGGDA